MASASYRDYQRRTEARRLGREEEHDHVRIYGRGDRPGIVFEERSAGEPVARSTYDSADSAKEHLNRIIDEHFQGEEDKGEQS